MLLNWESQADELEEDLTVQKLYVMEGSMFLALPGGLRFHVLLMTV